jgi:hypothetical protein
MDTLLCFEVQQLCGDRDHHYPWLPAVCRNRLYFDRCLFAFGEPAQHYFWFVYALQSPFAACFVKANPCEDEVDGGHGFAALHDASLHVFEHRFEIDWSVFVFSDEHFVDPGLPMQVLEGCTLRGSGTIVCEADWAQYDTVAASLPQVAAADAQGGSRKKEAADFADPIAETPIWVTYPWLMDDWDKCGHENEATPLPVADFCSSSACEHDPEDPVLSMSAEEVVTELEALRARWGQHDNFVLEDFKVSIRGGPWTQMAKGVVADICRAEACNVLAQGFCQHYQLPKSGSFSLAKFGESHAHSLARAWAHRFQFWFDLWIERGAHYRVLFVQGDPAKYNEPSWVADMRGECNRHSLDRLEQIRALNPKPLQS